MTVSEAVAFVDKMKPNRFSPEEKYRWLTDIDGMIVRELIDTHENSPLDGEFKGYIYGKDDDTVLIVPAPYDSLYRWYLESQIDLGNMEIGKYNNAKNLFNQQYLAYTDHYNRTHMPKQRGGFGFSGGRRSYTPSAGGITRETDPTVPLWAKQPKKPTYTADEVGAASAEDVKRLSEEIVEQFADRYTKTETDTAISEATKENEPEQIEEIYINDTVSGIVRDETPQGEEYKYQKIALTISTTGTNDIMGKWTQLKITTDDNKTISPFKVKGEGETLTGEQKMFAEVKDGYLSVKISGLTTNPTNLTMNNALREYQTNARNDGAKKYIKKIEIIKEVGFTAGDRIVIEGVRA